MGCKRKWKISEKSIKKEKKIGWTGKSSYKEERFKLSNLKYSIVHLRLILLPYLSPTSSINGVEVTFSVFLCCSFHLHPVEPPMLQDNDDTQLPCISSLFSPTGSSLKVLCESSIDLINLFDHQQESLCFHENEISKKNSSFKNHTVIWATIQILEFFD